MATGDCPTDCGRTVRRGQLMCPPCWKKVPRDLQDLVYKTWGAWRRDFGNTDKMRAYEDVRADAIAAVVR